MATANDYHNYVPQEFVVITLDTEFEPPLCGIRAAASGDLSVVDGKSNNPRVFPNVLAGETIKGVIRKVNTVGTTITSPTTNLMGFRH